MFGPSLVGPGAQLHPESFQLATSPFHPIRGERFKYSSVQLGALKVAEGNYFNTLLSPRTSIVRHPPPPPRLCTRTHPVSSSTSPRRGQHALEADGVLPGGLPHGQEGGGDLRQHRRPAQ